MSSFQIKCTQFELNQTNVKRPRKMAIILPFREKGQFFLPFRVHLQTSNWLLQNNSVRKIFCRIAGYIPQEAVREILPLLFPLEKEGNTFGPRKFTLLWSPEWCTSSTLANYYLLQRTSKIKNESTICCKWKF